MTEDKLVQKIKEAEEAKDYDKVQELMQDLIKMQSKIKPPEATDEELAKKGVDLLILKQERELRDRIREHEQNGEFIEAREAMRELVRIQKLQPEYVGVKIER